MLVTGADARVLLSPEYDRSDLFRFGGATTLRGYDEDRFLGRIVGRALVEYRILIDAVSYAYAFFDGGYVDRPATPDAQAAADIRPGYGMGVRFRTAAGIVNVSAALNPESGPGTSASMQEFLSDCDDRSAYPLLPAQLIHTIHIRPLVFCYAASY